MSTPKVSIVIPTYNYARYLRDAVDSALAQDYEPKEVIIVDDGSTDDTRDVVKNFPEVTYIYQENAGVSAARNRGLQEASGDFLVFLDADDVLDNSMVSSLVPCLLDDDTIAISACRAQRVDEDLRPLPQHNRDEKFVGQITGKHLLMSNRFATGGAVIRKSALLENDGFDEALVSTEDRDMWLRIAKDYRIILSSERLISIRSHSDSLSTNAGRAAKNMDAFVKKNVYSDAAEPISCYFRGAVNAYRDCQAAWMFFSEQQHSRAIVLMVRSLLRCPIFPRSYTTEPVLFRLRAIRTFIWGILFK